MNITQTHKQVFWVVLAAALVAVIFIFLPKAFVKGDTPPGSPNRLSADYVDPTLTISWGAPSDLGGAENVEYVIVVTGTTVGEVLNTSSTVESVSVSGLEPDLYSISVLTSTEFGQSEPSVIEHDLSQIGLTKIDPVTEFAYNTATLADEKKLDLTWSGVDGADSYLLTIYNKDTKVTNEYSIGAPKSSWVSEVLDPGTYTASIVTVTKTDGLINSDSVGLVFVVTSSGAEKLAPTAPTHFSYDADAANKGVLYVSWDANPGDVDSYTINIMSGKTVIISELLDNTAKAYSTSPDEGSYLVYLTATNREGSASTDNLSIDIKNKKIDPNEITINDESVDYDDKDSSTVSISWNTNFDSDSKIVYGPGKVYQDTKVYDETLVSEHSLRLANLFPCTIYNYQIVSRSETSTTEGSVNYFITKGCLANSTVSNYVSKAVATDSTDTVSLLDQKSNKKGSLEVIDSIYKNAALLVMQIKQIVVGKTDTDYDESSRKLVTGEVYDIKAFSDGETKVSQFEAPIKVTLNFVPSELDPSVNIDTLKIWHSDDDGITWKKLDNCIIDYNLDKDIGSIVCDTIEFSLFAIFGETSENNTSTPTKATNSVSGGTVAKNTVVNDLVPYKGDVPFSKVTFAKDLHQGMTDPDIKLLQKALNTLGFTVAINGVGSAGNETSYFGLQTKAAVVKFQKAHVQEIPNATGIVGPFTRTVLNKLISN